MIINSVTELIGNTPLLKIDSAIHGLKNIELYAKLELFNPWGSLKDRAAWGMIKDELESIKQNNQTILEMSSGNTAKALQIIASMHGIPFKTITNRIKVTEAKDILKLLGAEIEELPGKSDCHDPNDPNDPLVFINREIQKYQNKRYFTAQYKNQKNVDAHYKTTGEEIVTDLGKVDYLIAGLGTTGSSRGTGEKIKESNPNLQVVGVVAEKNDYIPGIRTRDEVFEVGLFQPEFYNRILSVDSGDAIDQMLVLIRNCGVLAGPTSGAVYSGAIEHLKEIDKTLTEKKTAVFIVCDRVEWYISYIRERRAGIFNEQSKTDFYKSISDTALSKVRSVRVEDAPEWIKENNPMIVDIRSPVSFKTAHIPGSINIPEEHLKQIWTTSNPFSRNQNLLIVCPVGEKSCFFAAAVSASQQSSHLEGGIVAWRNAGLALERSGDDR